MSVNIETITNAASKYAGKAKLVVGKHSPEILLGVGAVSLVASTVVACRSTLKVNRIMLETQGKFKDIEYAVENDDIQNYTEEDAKKDRILLSVQTGVKFAKLYAPAVGLGLFGFGCILGSHHILNKRNAAAVAACKLADTAFKEYRQRVVEQFGEEIDQNLRYDIHEEKVEIEEEQEDGTTKKAKKKVKQVAPWEQSQYARVFDKQHSRNAQDDRTHNLMFLEMQQNYFNDLLKARGHVFLNEVYQALGYDHSPEGALVGWVYDECAPSGDNFIDFCLMSELYRESNGYEDEVIVLDFNIDGIIYDLI
ncbi:MAG: hypothetical protein [Chaetfec virus UA24_144]|nr:MAG: hypothetical protein [Chaetfec virus UA24_144]